MRYHTHGTVWVHTMREGTSVVPYMWYYMGPYYEGRYRVVPYMWYHMGPYYEGKYQCGTIHVVPWVHTMREGTGVVPYMRYHGSVI